MRRARMFLATLVFLGAIFFPALAQASVCRVSDPTGTPLNVRTVPGGTKIVDTLQNGTLVTILDTKNKWAYIGLLPGKNEAPQGDKIVVPTGWVYRDYLDCTNQQTKNSPAFTGRICFDRHYDAAHLAKHPDQLVTSMTLALDPDAPVARGNNRNNVPFDFKIAMTKRGDNKLYVQEGSVKNSDGKYRGVVECDGGGFILQKAPSGVLLSIGLQDSAGYIRMAAVPDPCGESDRINKSVDIERGKDDDTFRLDAVSTQVCSRLFDKIDWDAVGRQNQ